jgi:hypothetical protein
LIAARPLHNRGCQKPSSESGPKPTRATDLVSLVKVLADKSHSKPGPALVKELWLGLHGEDPLATIGVCFVLPHGLDARLEEMIIGIALETRGGLEPVEVAAEGFDLVRESMKSDQLRDETLTVSNSPTTVSPAS